MVRPSQRSFPERIDGIEALHLGRSGRTGSWRLNGTFCSGARVGHGVEPAPTMAEMARERGVEVEEAVA